MKLATKLKSAAAVIVALAVVFAAAPLTDAAANLSDATCKSKRPRLSYDARGGCVNYAQRKLAAQGYMTYTRNTENRFGDRTKAAVLAIQRDYCLSTIGSVGPQTWQALHGERKKCSSRTSNSTGGIPQKCRNRMSGNKTICVVKDGGFGQLYAMRRTANGTIVLDHQIRIRTGDNRPGDWDTKEGTHSVIYGRKYFEYTNKDGVSMPRSLFFYKGQAIHYSDNFRGNPDSGASKGCVNIGDKGKATALWRWTPEGTRVYITK